MEPFLGLRRAFDALVGLPAAEWERCRRSLRAVPFEKGDVLLCQDDPVDWLGFLERGLVRIHTHTDEREVTLGFDCEQRFVGAFDAYVARSPARYGIEALEDGLLLRFERETLEEWSAAHPCWGELFRRIAEAELVRKIDKELRMRSESPEERYAALVKSGSFLVRRVPQYHLASYLGIAAETLSRIRARMGTGSVPAPRS